MNATLETVKEEIFKYTGKSGLAFFFRAWRTPGFKFMVSVRLANRTSKFHPLGMLSRYYYKKFYVKYGIQIPRATKIGRGFLISHFGGIIVNQKTVIGNNCTISQNVTLGHLKRGKMEGAPIIGNDVYIGAGAVIVGKVSIGNNALIAPLSFVNKDVPDNAVVAGNPCTVINYNGSKGYIVNPLLE